MNDEDVRGRVAFMKRGGVALCTKVKHAQDAGAIAALIVNTNNCTRKADGLRCEEEAADRAVGTGFAKRDPPNFWSEIRIPAFMVSLDDGRRLMRMMDLESMVMGDGLGRQWYDRHLNK